MFKASIIEAAAANCGQKVTDANEADHQEPTGAYAVVMEAFKLKPSRFDWPGSLLQQQTVTGGPGELHVWHKPG